MSGPSKREHRNPKTACDGKVRFDSYRQAIKAAKRQRDRNDSTGNVYHCQTCNGYHIGNRPQGSKPSHRNAKAAFELYRPSPEDLDRDPEQ